MINPDEISRIECRSIVNDVIRPAITDAVAWTGKDSAAVIILRVIEKQLLERGREPDRG